MTSFTSLVRTSASLALLAAWCLILEPVAAVNLTYYAPEADVDFAFANWIENFYTAAEASNTTAYGYQEYFSENATINLGGWDPTQDVRDGLIVRLHYPTTTTVIDDQDFQKTFDLLGLTKGYYSNGTCLVDSYETKFTIEKVDGKAELCPRSGSLIALNLVGQTAQSQSCESF